MAKTPAQDNSSDNRSVMRWMSLLSTGQVSEKFFIFGKTVLQAYLFGISWQLDAFLLGMMAPTLFMNFAGDALFMYSLYVFSENKDNKRESWEVSNILITLAVTLVLGFTVLYAVVLGVAAHVIRDMDMGRIQLSLKLALMLCPLFLFYAMHAMLKGISQALRLFGVSSFTFSITYGTAMVFLWLFRDKGIYGYVYATLIAEGVTALCFVPQLVSAGLRFRPDFRFRHPRLMRTYAYGIKLTLSSGSFKLSVPINRFFAALLPEGTVSVFNYALNFIQIFSSFLRAFVDAVFPSMTQASQARDAANVRRYNEMALRAMAIVGIPMAAIVWMLRYQIISLLKFGAFDANAVHYVSDTVAWFIPCILLFPLTYLQVRLFVILKHNRLLTAIGFVCMGLIAGLDWLLMRWGVKGLAAANTLALGATMLICSIYLTRETGPLNARLVATAVGKALMGALACMFGIAAVGGLLRHMPLPANVLGLLVILVVKGSAGTLCALLTLYALRTHEVMEAFGYFGKVAGSWRKS